MTRLARSSDIQQRTADMMIADLDGPLAHVGHVAISAGDAAARVNSLTPRLEFRVLSLEQWRLRRRMGPVGKLDFVVVAFNLVSLERLMRGVSQQLLFALEVILYMALNTDHGSQLLPARHRVRVIGFAASALPPLPDAGKVRRIARALGQFVNPR